MKRQVTTFVVTFTVSLMSVQALAQNSNYEKFCAVNANVLNLYRDRRTHQIIQKVDSSEYFTTWRHRNFLYNGKLLDWNYDDVLEAYKAMGEAYLRNQDTEKAEFFIRRMLVLEPEYFYRNESDLKYLLKRFMSLKFTIGVNGIYTFIRPRIHDQSKNHPDGGRISEKLRRGDGLKSSFFAGIELVQNPALRSSIRSADFYLEYMFHSDRFYHHTTTTFAPGQGFPEKVENRITERQDWQSLLLYPRLRWNTSNEQWTVYSFTGMGINWLKSDDFFEIHQKIDDGTWIELSPVKLYKKEKMRNGTNISLLIGTGLNYTVSRNITFYLTIRYLRMMRKLTSDFSLDQKPLQGPPLYYVDKSLYLDQFSMVGGVSANIGACPRWLGF